MCGLTGFIYKGPVDWKVLETMNQAMAYRGPDDHGIFFEPYGTEHHIGLGHRRLAIFDLSPQAHQPMISENGHVVLVYNGEVYNFKDLRCHLEAKGYGFRSHCDTEVILKAYEAYGIDFVKHLNGMFALALYDRKSQELFLIRDRLGVKPLYYSLQGDNLLFASEMKALMAFPGFEKKLNPHALSLLLKHGYITAPHTIFTHTHKLMPGTYLRYAQGQITLEPYWDLGETFQKRKTCSDHSEGQWVDALEQRLMTSLKQRVVADVPVGCFLSGGVDSSLMTALMQRLTPHPIKTFTVGFEDPEYDESPYAQAVAQYLGTDHHTAYLSRSHMLNLIQRLPHVYDEPFADSSQIPTLFLCEQARHHVTVALSGDGGDELFCGYNRYDAVLRLQKYQMAAKIARKIPFFRACVRFLKPDTRYSAFFELLSPERSINVAYWDFLGNPSLIKDHTPSFDPRYQEILTLSSHVQEKNMLLDLTTYLPDDILVKVDRASMAASLEARPPLVDDHETLEFSFSVPHHLKYNQGQKKYLLKKLLYRYVPEEFFKRPKMGFGIPLQSFLRHDLKEMMGDFSNPTFLKSQNIFCERETEQLFQRVLNPKRKETHAHFVAWHFLMFQLWHQRYGGTL